MQPIFSITTQNIADIGQVAGVTIQGILPLVELIVGTLLGVWAIELLISAMSKKQ